jgi:hypothetical protein
MANTGTITTLFIDLGKVLLTDSWHPAMWQKAVEQFVFCSTRTASTTLNRPAGGMMRSAK